MTKPVTYMPPGRGAPAPDLGRVRRRHVLYVPGYDPDAKIRARALFLRELGRHARRFGLGKRMSAPSDLPDVPAMRWSVAARRDDWSVETTYDVMAWDDIVRSDFARPFGRAARDVAAMSAGVLASGLLLRLFRMNRLFACVFVYPYAMLAGLVGLAAAAGAIAAALSLRLGAGGWLSASFGILAGLGVAASLLPRFRGWYVWHLLRDWVFNWEHGSGARPDYTARVDRFAAHLRGVARSEVDEILVVGHSSGAAMAMETLARALALDPSLARHGPRVALLTLGTSLPAAAFNPGARAIHADIARLMAAPEVLWVEYQAPQDWLNAAWFNPVHMLPLGLAEAECANPVIRSSRFAELVTEETYRTMTFNPFRMHFQFMMANDRAGEYDYFMIVLGPMYLEQRIARPDEAALLIAPVTDALEPASSIAQSLNTETATS